MAETNHDGRPASSARIDKLRALFDRIDNVSSQTVQEADPEAATRAMDALLDEFQNIAAEIWRQPVSCWAGIVERALLVWHCEAGGGGPISLTDPTLSHSELARRHLLTAIVGLDADGRKETVARAGRSDVDTRDAIDEQLDKLKWLGSIAGLTGTHLEDHDCYPGGWEMMRHMSYQLAHQIEEVRGTIKTILNEHRGLACGSFRPAA